MKTNKLIELLQKADPSGESNVLIGNMDILPIIYEEAGYWDGRMRLAEYNEGNKHPDRIRVTSSGSKINLIQIDPQERFVDSILYHQKEFDYDVESSSKVYPYSQEHYRALDTKLCWVHIAESYCSWFFDYEGRKPYEEKTKQLISDLKKKFSTQAKEAQLYYAENNLKGKTKTATIDLINKIYEYAPLTVLAAISHGSDSIYVRAESNWKYEFSITNSTLGFGGGTVKFFVSNGNKKEELEFNDESFKLFAALIDKYYENRTKE